MKRRNSSLTSEGGRQRSHEVRGEHTLPVEENDIKTDDSIGNEEPKETPSLPSVPEPGFHRFMDLAPELRFKIYRLAFSAVSGRKLIGGFPPVRLTHNLSAYGRIPARSRITTGLLRVNHEIYHEALEFLYRGTATLIIPPERLHVLMKLSQMPAALASCSSLGCRHPSKLPIIEKAQIHPREFDEASQIPTGIPDLETTMRSLRQQGGIRITHLVLSVSGDGFHMIRNSQQWDDIMNKWYCLAKSFRASQITGMKSFTIKAMGGSLPPNPPKPWDALHGLKIWLKSRECKTLIEYFNLQRVPSIRVFRETEHARTYELKWSALVSGIADTVQNVGNVGVSQVPILANLMNIYHDAFSKLTFRQVFPDATIQFVEGDDVLLEASGEGFHWRKNLTREQMAWLEKNRCEAEDELARVRSEESSDYL